MLLLLLSLQRRISLCTLNANVDRIYTQQNHSTFTHVRCGMNVPINLFLGFYFCKSLPYLLFRHKMIGHSNDHCIQIKLWHFFLWQLCYDSIWIKMKHKPDFVDVCFEALTYNERQSFLFSLFFNFFFSFIWLIWHGLCYLMF